MFIKAKITNEILKNDVLKNCLEPGQIVFGIAEPSLSTATIMDGKGATWTLLNDELEITGKVYFLEVFND